jgi:predicted TIM-barrel fold metal-dependent hydrolase
MALATVAGAAVARIDRCGKSTPSPTSCRLAIWSPEATPRVDDEAGPAAVLPEGVFRFSPIISDLDARLRMMARYGDYAQVLVLAVPPLEEMDPPQAASELARRANDEMADLVRRFPERFAGFAAALPLGDVEASLIEIDHAIGELGALGVQVFTNVRGAPLDHPR